MRSKVEASKGKSKRQNPFGTNGGNGGHSQRRAIKDIPNKNKGRPATRQPYDFAGQKV